MHAEPARSHGCAVARCTSSVAVVGRISTGAGSRDAAPAQTPGSCVGTTSSLGGAEAKNELAMAASEAATVAAVKDEAALVLAPDAAPAPSASAGGVVGQTLG